VPRLVEQLEDEELVRLLDLLRGADSVELKLTVPEDQHRSTVAALGMDPLDAQIRQVFFFDTPDLALSDPGVVVRARRIQGKAHDSVVKLRPIVPSELPGSVRDSPKLVVEVDAMPDGYVCSAALKNKLGSNDVIDAVSGRLALSKLFSKEQRQFFRAHAPNDLELDDLSVMGPIFVLKLKFVPEDQRRKLVAEMWLYPDGSRILELSTKCAPSEAFQVAAEGRGYLARHGVVVSDEQQTKTRTALEYFSRELQSTAAGG
jgi:hypothetical protein